MIFVRKRTMLVIGNVGLIVTIDFLKRVSERELLAYSALKKELVTDSLTKLPNRRKFHELVEGIELDADLTFMMIDIVYFKKVNDRYGIWLVMKYS